MVGVFVINFLLILSNNIIFSSLLNNIHIIIFMLFSKVYHFIDTSNHSIQLSGWQLIVLEVGRLQILYVDD